MSLATLNQVMRDRDIQEPSALVHCFARGMEIVLRPRLGASQGWNNFEINTSSAIFFYKPLLQFLVLYTSPFFHHLTFIFPKSFTV
jgi:hypothetical protein